MNLTANDPSVDTQRLQNNWTEKNWYNWNQNSMDTTETKTHSLQHQWIIFPSNYTFSSYKFFPIFVFPWNHKFPQTAHLQPSGSNGVDVEAWKSTLKIWKGKR